MLHINYVLVIGKGVYDYVVLFQDSQPDSHDTPFQDVNKTNIKWWVFVI